MPTVLVIVRAKRERAPEQVVMTLVGLLCYFMFRLMDLFKWDQIFLDVSQMQKLSTILLIM